MNLAHKILVDCLSGGPNPDIILTDIILTGSGIDCDVYVRGKRDRVAVATIDGCQLRIHHWTIGEHNKFKYLGLEFNGWGIEHFDLRDVKRYGEIGEFILKIRDRCLSECPR